MELVTSPYALLEAQRNIQLKKPSAYLRLSKLAEKVEISSESTRLKNEYGLPQKDRPILESAMGCGCAFLLTGDVTHFGHLIGKDVEGVQVMTVSMFQMLGIS